MLAITSAATNAFAAPSMFAATRAPLAVKMQEAAVVEPEMPTPAPFDGIAFAKSLPGITGPLDFFDPMGFCSQEGVTEGKIRFYREVELKHCRVAMLAALGFPLAEQFHPLFGGNVDVPSYVAFQATPLQTFWGAVVFARAAGDLLGLHLPEPGRLAAVDHQPRPQARRPRLRPECVSRAPRPSDRVGPPSTLRAPRPARPLLCPTLVLTLSPLFCGWRACLRRAVGLKPTNEAELKEMQNKELNNGRLAMIAIAGMVTQELVTGAKLF